MPQYLVSVWFVEGAPEPSEEEMAQSPRKDVDVFNDELQERASGSSPAGCTRGHRHCGQVRGADVLTTDGPLRGDQGAPRRVLVDPSRRPRRRPSSWARGRAVACRWRRSRSGRSGRRPATERPEVERRRRAERRAPSSARSTGAPSPP